MATVGGTHRVRCGAWLLAGLLGVFGCSDRHLTAILPAPIDANAGGDNGDGSSGSGGGPPAASASCGPSEGQGAGPLPAMGWNGWDWIIGSPAILRCCRAGSDSGSHWPARWLDGPSC